METIELKSRENPDFEDQFNYLIRREFYVNYYKFRRFPYYLIGATLILFGMILFTSSNSLVSLKAVSIALLSLTWFVTFLFSISILIKWYNRNKWKKSSIARAKKDDSNYKLFFDKEKIIFDTPTYKTELSWDYFTYWTEYKNSIFIFPKSNLYEAIYYSESDLGVRNYLELKNIATEKFKKLTD